MGRKREVESDPFRDNEKLCLVKIMEKMANPIDYDCSRQDFQAKLKKVNLHIYTIKVETFEKHLICNTFRENKYKICEKLKRFSMKINTFFW